SEDTITVLNAELRHKLTPDHEYTIRIPKGSLDKFNSVYNDIPETEKPTFTYARSQSPRSASIHSNSKSKSAATYDTHRVRRGETLASIANKYGVSVRALQRANRLSRKNGLNSGQIVRIPGGTSVASSNNNDSVAVYKVKKTDSLNDISKRFDVPVSKLKKANNLKGNHIQAGRKIKIPGQELACDPPKGKSKKGKAAKNGKKRTIAKK
ncbi:MAG: rane-bound lytic murein transglycosylase precursor, partial [Deltaproteobacteria bacterium]|nr:rane-bound lytic murein transglycosylase precursor [Deltaproteobacteria bacterium]